MNALHRCATLVALFVTSACMLPCEAAAQSAAADSGAVVQVVHRFHEALTRGDSSAVMALLSPDVVIMEGGAVERNADYRSHHLSGDIAFARALPAARGAVQVVVSGDAAWAWSTSITQGTYKARTINSSNAELMVMSRVNDTWLIRSIHWSSRARK